MVATVLALSVLAAEPAGQQSSMALQAPPVCLIDFGAKWCGPCRRMHPIINRLRRKGYPIVMADIDDKTWKQWVDMYKIQSVPYFLMVVDGTGTEYLVGETSETRLESWLKTTIEKRFPEGQDAQH